MPRYYHAGSLEALDLDAMASVKAIDDTEKDKFKDQYAKHHPLSRPAREQLVAKDGKVYLKKPGMFASQFTANGDPIPELVEWTTGSIALGIPGYGFWVVPPGGHVDIDPTVSEDLIKSHAPHLLTEAEYLVRKPQITPTPDKRVAASK